MVNISLCFRKNLCKLSLMARRKDHTREELREMALRSTAELIEEEGLRDVSIRKIAAKMGYTSGTLYQLFPNLDTLLFEVNTATLRRLLEETKAQDFALGARHSLIGLARTYLEFATRHRNLMSAVFEHHTGRRDVTPKSYEAVVTDLVSMGGRAIANLVDDETSRGVEARVLWSALYGLVTLELAGNQSVSLDTEVLIKTLVETYVSGLEVRYGVTDRPLGG